MPTYSYRCTECDNAFDIHQAFTDDSLSVCDICGGKLRKVFNSIGVTFNGSGFYRTDSRSGGSSLPSAPGSGASSSSAASSGGSSDSGKASPASTSSSASVSGASSASASSASKSGTSTPPK
ncbi:FmdB family transcriptional regulator [Leifsonia sp. Root4]|uniref:FmdB family zinc ribbon protein n=1 Tax=Leifsonia sp. Root4 TaxID=1736525 RepID=UPI0006FCB8D4|nr:FmdB family zinc ribbon protein [Leifsonia sp. Root4]KQW06316.1 FmdB family transcriptional regulator [Leifsonia sp. Root4]